MPRHLRMPGQVLTSVGTVTACHEINPRVLCSWSVITNSLEHHTRWNTKVSADPVTCPGPRTP
jgi:hypothetical protein